MHAKNLWVVPGLLCLGWLAQRGLGFQSDLPGDPDTIARETIASATRMADDCLTANRADVEQCKAEIKAAARSEARNIARRYNRQVSRRTLGTERAIRKLRNRASVAIADGGDRDLAGKVRIACNKQVKRVDDSGVFSIWDINVAAGMPQTLPGG